MLAGDLSNPYSGWYLLYCLDYRVFTWNSQLNSGFFIQQFNGKPQYLVGMKLSQLVRHKERMFFRRGPGTGGSLIQGGRGSTGSLSLCLLQLILYRRGSCIIASTY